MHVFLLNIPRLEFAALIPKGDFITLCLLGDDVDEDLVRSFITAAEVRACFPDRTVPEHVCHCFPHINVRAADPPFGERIVFVGDCGVARLYKDGIGSAYRTAKAAARTAVFRGVSAADFRAHFWPACKAIDFDNTLGRLVFASSSLVQRWRFSRRAMLRMTEREQRVLSLPGADTVRIVHGSPRQINGSIFPHSEPDAFAEALTLAQSAWQAVPEELRGEGYLEATYQGAQVALDPGGAEVTLRLREGPRTDVEAVVIEGSRALGLGELQPAVRLAPGDPLSWAKVEEGRSALIRRYAARGHVFARVEVREQVDPARHLATLRYVIEEGPQVRVGRVLITGNRRTREDLITSGEVARSAA